MPKFAKEEKHKINNALLLEGERLFASQGVNKVTIDELTKATGISHGAFYSFYKNKEHLFMEVNILHQEMIFSSIDDLIQKDSTLESKELMKKILLHLIAEFSESLIISQMTPELWIKIERKIPKESIAKNDTLDSQLLSRLLKTGVVLKYDENITVKSLQTIFLTLSKLTDDKDSKKITEIILDGIVDQLFR